MTVENDLFKDAYEMGARHAAESTDTILKVLVERKLIREEIAVLISTELRKQYFRMTRMAAEDIVSQDC